MKTIMKKLSVLFVIFLFVASGALAQINWLKENAGEQYLAWDNGTKSKTIQAGQSATFDPLLDNLPKCKQQLT